MAPGAGFAAFDGNYNPGCETGIVLSQLLISHAK